MTTTTGLADAQGTQQVNGAHAGGRASTHFQLATHQRRCGSVRDLTVSHAAAAAARAPAGLQAGANT